MTAEAGPVGRRRLAQLRAELTACHTAILGSLRELHYATTRHIERLHFHGIGLTRLSAARLAHRHMLHLHRSGLVDRLQRRVGGERAGSASFVWHLSPAGARLVGIETRRRRYEPGLAHLAHVLDVTELAARVLERTRADDVELLDLQAEPACWWRFQAAHGMARWLKPDLRITLGVGPHALHWFAEIDRATEDRRTLGRKLAIYLAAWREGSLQATVGTFPGVLWIAPTPNRRDVIQQVINHTTGIPPNMMSTCVENDAIHALIDYSSSN